MKRLLRGTVTLAGSLALAGAAVAAAAVPAAASGPGNFAYGSSAPAGAITGGPNDQATAPPADTEVANNVNVNGLLSTGTTYDTASTASAYAKVSNVTAPSTLGSALTWTSGANSYGFTLSSSLVNAYCGPAGDSVSINSGKLTETSWVTATGVQLSKQVFNLPQHPALGQTYTFNGGTVILNTQTTVGSVTQVVGITVTTGALTPQTLLIAVAGCGVTTPGTGGIVNGTFDNPASITNPPWDTTGTTGAAASVIVITGGGPAGSNAARLGCAACTAGGTSVLAQTFTAGGSSLTFDYEQSCISGAGSLNVTLKNNTTNSLTSLIINRCTTDSGFATLTPPAMLIPGDSYTLAFTNIQAPGYIATTLLANVIIS